ncbi:hypothetical protein KC332_g1329 [Hortaea werneckii]|nr:hypothetical protein KC350_g5384 [Hortaea werneckii]KAI6849166.1 hypothetical protein KC358_g1327 [Hortaea werneckii]KAI6931802.1 hypothetical protein KC341_g9385 [Hortaea werneckii]KAI6949635.1 hypothetical protein KC348_g1196 [Hortaea werneckii]KAI6969646.1 hypothetical protein KC321_g7763 [Hortaea werneckii]
MVAPPDYPWCYNCITRGCSSCDMRDTYPNPCTNCNMHFRNNNKKITCKRSGLTTEEWNEKKATETQKLQRNANPMFEFAQAQQDQMPFPMFSPHLGQAASFSPNIQLNDMRRSTPAQPGPSQHRNPIMGSTSPQNYYPPYGQQAYGYYPPPMPQGYPPPMHQGYPPPMHHPPQPPVQRQSGGYDQPPPAGNMHHPMHTPMQYPTQPLMHPPPGGHQQSPPAGDQQRQGYQGVEQRDYAQPPPGPLATPIAASSPVPEQQQIPSDTEMSTQPHGEPDAFGPDHEAKKQRAKERARAKRNNPDT